MKSFAFNMYQIKKCSIEFLFNKLFMYINIQKLYYELYEISDNITWNFERGDKSNNVTAINKFLKFLTCMK